MEDRKLNIIKEEDIGSEDKDLSGEEEYDYRMEAKNESTELYMMSSLISPEQLG